VVVRTDAGERLAQALLTRTRTAGYTSISLVGHRVSDHARIPAVDQAAAEAVARGILSVLSGVQGPWRLGIEQVPEGDPVVGCLARELRYVRVREGDVCPMTRFGTDRSLARHLSKNAWGKAQQGRNRLSREDPDWRVERTRDPSAIAALLPLVVAVHRRRDHALGRRSDLDSPHRIAFYTGATQALAEEGRVELATLRVRDVVAAYLLVLLDGDVWRFWDNRIDVGHAHLHAGRVLDTAMLAAALEDPSVAAVDWMRGQMQHKQQASNDVVRTTQLTAWSSPAARSAEDAVRAAHVRLRAAVPGTLRQRIQGRSRGVSVPPR
jgi:hypothetical protein